MLTTILLSAALGLGQASAPPVAKLGPPQEESQPAEEKPAELIATEFGHSVKRVSESDVEEGFLDADDSTEDGAADGAKACNNGEGYKTL